MTIKKSKSDYIFLICNYTIFGLLTLLCAYPFYYIIINSLSANDLSAAGLVNFLPKGVHLKNYTEVLKLSGLPLAVLVSVGRTVIGTACTVMASAFLGYMFAQKKMWHRKFWYRFMIITMYFNAGMIPMFMTMRILHLTNSEQVIHMEFAGGEINAPHSGALQDFEIRDAICDVMEGGRDALESRYYRITKALE